MQEIRRSHLQFQRWHAPHSAWAWFALIFGALAAVLAWSLNASVGLAVVFLLLAAVPFIWLGFWARRPIQTPMSESAVGGYWQDWLAGWYWQTDEEHRLTVLKPDGHDSSSWLAVQHWTQSRQPLWACWDQSPKALSEAHRVLLSMLEMRMKSRLALDMDELPWPVWATQADAEAAVCRIKGVPRLDAKGQFLGFHGVWQRCGVSPRQAENVPTPSHQQADAEGVQADQEVLRYALSHDLRAPLRVADGFARILKEDYSKLLDRIGNDHLDRVLAATARMNGMIDAILAQAQLSQSPLQLTQVDLSALALEVAQEQVAARRADLGSDALVEVALQVACDLTTQADAPLVRRVLDNLIGNALKYSGKVAQPRIEVGMVPATDPEVYFVRDNGAGFDMQHADKLFGLFQRLHSTKEFPGTGVGLAGVKNIIHRHGGRVWAEAAPGQGACFYFTLKPSVAAVALKGSVHRAQA